VQSGVFQVHPNVQLKTRAEWSRYEKENTVSNGFVVYQDIIFKKIGSPVSFSMRYAIMDAPDWNSRIYAYENDLSSVYSMKAWQDRGISIYAIVQYHVNKIVQIKTKFATVRYSDIHSTGSGVDEISGQLFNEIKFELTLKI